MLIGFGAHVAGIHHSPQRWLVLIFAYTLLIISVVNYSLCIICTSFLFTSNLCCVKLFSAYACVRT